MKTSTVVYNGNRYKLSEVCDEFGVNITTLMNALKAGIGIHEFMDKLKHSEPKNELNKFEQVVKTANENPDPEISILNDKEILPVMVKDPVNLAEIIAGKCKKFNTVNLIDFENLSDNHSIINELNDKIPLRNKSLILYIVVHWISWELINPTNENDNRWMTLWNRANVGVCVTL